MAHPKRKTSKARRDKRRTHLKVATPTLTTCQATGEIHRAHHAYWHEGKLYWKGQVAAIDERQQEEEEDED